MELISRTRESLLHYRNNAREHTTKEQPGHDFEQCGQHDDERKRAQESRLSYNPLHTVHLEMPLRAVSL